jgi:putative glycosyltransferase (TIGR04348 family)
MPKKVPTVLIVTPYLADANNGNWRTARRWQALLQSNFRVIVQSAWPVPAAEQHANTPADVMIALHARRSAASIAAFRAAHPTKPLIVVLTGTDLYRDLSETFSDSSAHASLGHADALVVLQDDAVRHVPMAHRKKTHVVFQSAPTLTPAQKTNERIGLVAVGHLRDEKDPETIFKLVERLAAHPLPVHITHIGAPLDDALAARAQALDAEHEHYHWADMLPHGLTRAAIKRAHLLIHPSRMEGGANVIVEAITSGTAVLASQMSGNVGMLGDSYAGYFAVGDHLGLYDLLARYVRDRNFQVRLQTQVLARAKLFSPEHERDTVNAIVKTLLDRANS